nr:MAG TPA: hypothetical protein [Crassvirales sp.]DAP16690.1 MAG TPA: hypothetical protein [Caudoviricetes sp.]
MLRLINSLIYLRKKVLRVLLIQSLTVILH